MSLQEINAALFNFLNGLPALVLLVFGVPMLLGGAEWLVRGAVSLARRAGISTLVIGLTIVAAGTSTPELVVNIMSVTAGNSDLGFGNVIGSNICNIGLIIGLGAILTPMVVNNQLIRAELPWLIIISGGMLILGLPLPFFGGVTGYGRVEGVIFLLVFAWLMWAWYRRVRSGEDAEIAEEAIEVAVDKPAGSAIAATALFLVGLGILLAGGQLTRLGAVKLAANLGMSEAMIGLTIVAVSTSLPELITTVIACIRGHTDLGVGNVVGSNIFNIVVVLGITATIKPVGIPGAAGWQDLSIMMTFALLLWWFCITQQRKVVRWEGAVLLTLYFAYVGWCIVRELG